MRLLFFGTSYFAVPSIEALCRSEHEVIGVVSQPDRPAGRGMNLTQTPVKKAALAIGLDVFTPEIARNTEFIELVRLLNPDALIVAAYGQILSQELLDIPRHGGINVHGSLLPKYRGAAPIQRAILLGEEVTGITIMQMDKGMDTGPIGLKLEIPINPDDNSGSLEDKLAQTGAHLLLEALDSLKLGKLQSTPQNNDDATYATAIKKEEGRINWEESVKQCHNRIRAFTPRPGAFTFWQGKYVKLWCTELTEGNGEPGEVLDVHEGITVACKEGALRLLEVQPEGKPRMPSSAFTNGHRVKQGQRFGS
jgi:methionyl-tRNA formyltransferase